MRPLLRRFVHSYKKVRVFSLSEVARRVSLLLVKLIIVSTGLGLAPILINPGFRATGFAPEYIATEFGKANIDIWLLLAVATFLVLLDELRTYLQKTNPGSEESVDGLVRNLYIAAIEEVYNEDGKHPDPIKSLLQRMENAVVAIIGAEAARSAVSSNLMVYEKGLGTPDKLTLKRWGNMLPDRIAIELDVDETLPGAPAAFVKRKVMYVDDTQSDKFRKFFEGKEYRSIVSIPVARLNSEHELCGIINIDSSRPNLFRSERFIEEELIPRLKPIVNLIAAQWSRV